MWKAVKQRGWDLTGGLKRNRKPRIVNAAGEREWMPIDDFATELSAEQFQPRGPVRQANVPSMPIFNVLASRNWVLARS
jgi:hypothetical protein